MYLFVYACMYVCVCVCVCGIRIINWCGCIYYNIIVMAMVIVLNHKVQCSVSKRVSASSSKI